MRTAMLIGLCLLCGCTRNRDQLRAIRDRMEVELAERKELAQNLSERRKEIDALEQELADAADAGVRVDDVPAAANAAPAERASLPPPELPAPSIWEGSESARLRTQIVDIHKRIAELDKVIGEVNGIERHKRELEQRLKRVKDIKRAGNQMNEAY